MRLVTEHATKHASGAKHGSRASAHHQCPRKGDVPPGFFAADMRRDRINFVYAFKLSNRNKNVLAPAECEAVRAYLATNPPIRGRGFGLLRLNVDDHVHTATTVHILYRVTKSSTSARSVTLRTQP